MHEKRQLGTIKSAEIVIEDHGILTINIGIDGSGWGQGVPSLCYDYHNNRTGKRGYSRTMAMFLREIMETFGVYEFSSLVGKPCYVLRETGDMITALESVPELGYKYKKFDLSNIKAEGQKEMDEQPEE